MAEPYLVPAETQRTETMVANSRFVATVVRVETSDDVRPALSRIRAELPDASHHVYAFRVGFGNSTVEGMSDDGEPSGTAGPPVLSVLRGTRLGDVLIVVTRYFGGTKLGTGGLVRAYTEAAHIAFNALKTELKIEKRVLGIDLPYTFYEQVKRLIASHDGQIQDEIFGAEIALVVQFIEPQIAGFTQALVELTAGRVNPVTLS